MYDKQIIICGSINITSLCHSTKKSDSIEFFSIQESRLSAKRTFCVKLQSQIIDFSNNFELLHFHFDRWIYKTVSGMNMQDILR